MELDLERKQIKGITLRTLITLIGGIIAIEFTGLMAYNSLKSDQKDAIVNMVIFQKVQEKLVNKQEVIEAKQIDYEKRIAILEVEVNELINKNRNNAK